MRNERAALPATVLVADDNPDNLALARDVLEEAGYRVRVALDGDAALASLRAALPDLLLLDVHMPKRDGYAVCAAVKEDPASAELPVLFLSGMDETFNKVQAFRAGADDYVVKPFRKEELLARVSLRIELARSRARMREDAERLRKAYGELERANGRALRAERAALMAAVSAGLAHELNNPVNYLRTCAEALAVDFAELLALAEPRNCADAAAWTPLREEIPALLDGIRLGADRSSRVLKSLESLGEADAGPTATLRIADAAERAFAAARELAPEGVELTRDFSPAARVEGREEKLVELFFHVLSNAVEAAARAGDGRVETSLEPVGETVVFEARDTGPGIPSDARDSVFAPFFTTKRAGEGAGLGLTIAARIAEAHGGRIEIAANGDRGTLCRVTLPAAPL